MSSKTRKFKKISCSAKLMTSCKLLMKINFDYNPSFDECNSLYQIYNLTLNINVIKYFLCKFLFVLSKPNFNEVLFWRINFYFDDLHSVNIWVIPGSNMDIVKVCKVHSIWTLGLTVNWPREEGAWYFRFLPCDWSVIQIGAMSKPWTDKNMTSQYATCASDNKSA